MVGEVPPMVPPMGCSCSRPPGSCRVGAQELHKEPKAERKGSTEKENSLHEVVEEGRCGDDEESEVEEDYARGVVGEVRLCPTYMVDRLVEELEGRFWIPDSLASHMGMGVVEREVGRQLYQSLVQGAGDLLFHAPLPREWGGGGAPWPPSPSPPPPPSYQSTRRKVL